MRRLLPHRVVGLCSGMGGWMGRSPRSSERSWLVFPLFFLLRGVGLGDQAFSAYLGTSTQIKGPPFTCCAWQRTNRAFASDTEEILQIGAHQQAGNGVQQTMLGDSAKAQPRIEGVLAPHMASHWLCLLCVMPDSWGENSSGHLKGDANASWG